MVILAQGIHYICINDLAIPAQIYATFWEIGNCNFSAW